MRNTTKFTLKYIEKVSDKANCMTEGCAGKEFARGICKSCYSSAFNLINSSRETWEHLEQIGMCRPFEGRGPKKKLPRVIKRHSEEKEVKASVWNEKFINWLTTTLSK